MPQTPFLWYHIYICFPEIWCRFYLPWTPYYHLQHITSHSRQIYSQISIHMFTSVSIPSHLLKKISMTVSACKYISFLMTKNYSSTHMGDYAWFDQKKQFSHPFFSGLIHPLPHVSLSSAMDRKKTASKHWHIYLSTIKKYILMKIIRKKNSALHSPYKIYITSKQKHRKLFPTIKILPKKNLYYIITVPIPMFLPAKSDLPPPLPPFFTINTI